VLDGTIQPGRVFEPAIRLDEVPGGYRAMASREAIKVLINLNDPRSQEGATSGRPHRRRSLS
jgi:hypothetical protein